MAQAICEHQQGKLSVVHVWELYAESVLHARMPADELQRLEREARAGLEQSYDKLLSQHALSIRNKDVHLLQGEPAAVIERFVEQHGVDLLVLGTVARGGISGLLMGNTAEQLMGKVKCSLLALKPDGFVSPIQLPEE
jgi:nucleotide-binding universal stress UspA family protein